MQTAIIAELDSDIEKDHLLELLKSHNIKAYSQSVGINKYSSGPYRIHVPYDKSEEAKQIIENYLS